MPVVIASPTSATKALPIVSAVLSLATHQNSDCLRHIWMGLEALFLELAEAKLIERPTLINIGMGAMTHELEVFIRFADGSTISTPPEEAPATVRPC